jgi:hypothetical protein
MALFEMRVAIDAMMEDIRKVPENESVPLDLFSLPHRDVAEMLTWRKQLALLAVFGPARSSPMIRKSIKDFANVMKTTLILES